jgi:8-oxo-dGTP pyrophosphatase MutT (NUDIX family)
MTDSPPKKTPTPRFIEAGEKLVPNQQPLVPRDAATLVILDRSGAEPKILMGKRRADLAFMAGKYVFPGGRVDPADKTIRTAADLRAGETAKLLAQMRGKPSLLRARALAAAAVREAFEEAGLVIGAQASADVAAAPPSWQPFLTRGFVPTLAPLTFFARAITPPGRPRRFDTRFFCMDATAIAERVGHNDGELSGLDWLTLDDARGLDLPNITRLVIEDLQAQLTDGSLDAGRNPVPFYYARGGSFRRDLLTG